MPQYSAKATANGSATAQFFFRQRQVVTSSASATATSDVSYEDAYNTALQIAQEVADSVAQNNANIIVQSVNTSTLGDNFLYLDSSLLKDFVTEIGDGNWYLGENLELPSYIGLRITSKETLTIGAHKKLNARFENAGTITQEPGSEVIMGGYKGATNSTNSGLKGDFFASTTSSTNTTNTTNSVFSINEKALASGPTELPSTNNSGNYTIGTGAVCYVGTGCTFLNAYGITGGASFFNEGTLNNYGYFINGVTGSTQLAYVYCEANSLLNNENAFLINGPKGEIQIESSTGYIYNYTKNTTGVTGNILNQGYIYLTDGVLALSGAPDYYTFGLPLINESTGIIYCGTISDTITISPTGTIESGELYQNGTITGFGNPGQPSSFGTLENYGTIFKK